MRTEILYLILCVVFSTTICVAQTSINSAGSDILGPTGSVSYSIGQVFANSFDNSFANIISGVQQPYFITPLLSNETETNDNIDIYPNPCFNELYLTIDYKPQKKVSYRIYTVGNKLVQQGKITNLHRKIDISRLRESVLMLAIISDNKVVKTFKIFKLP